MTANRFTYRAGAELPGLTLPWKEELTAGTFTDLDLSSGYTFTLSLVDSSAVTALTKTTNITGTTTGATVAWATDELDIAVGHYSMYLRARETATSKYRDYRPDSPITIVIT